MEWQYKTKPRKNEICLNRIALSGLKDLLLFLLFVPFRFCFPTLLHFLLNEFLSTWSFLLYVFVMISLFFGCFHSVSRNKLSLYVNVYLFRFISFALSLSVHVCVLCCSVAISQGTLTVHNTIGVKDEKKTAHTEK